MICPSRLSGASALALNADRAAGKNSRAVNIGALSAKLKGSPGGAFFL